MKTLYKWSVADYHQIVESGVFADKFVELLEGEIITMSPESPLHSSVNYSVADYLRNLLGNLAIVREAHPITLDNSEPEPDIAIVSVPYTQYFSRHPYAQDVYWLVEIANKTLAKDLNDKSVTYARNGIGEYWVIDLVNNKLWLFRDLENNSYQVQQKLTTGVIKPIAFPEINVNVERLLNIS